jgi:hypothetical protein
MNKKYLKEAENFAMEKSKLKKQIEELTDELHAKEDKKLNIEKEILNEAENKISK